MKRLLHFLAPLSFFLFFICFVPDLKADPPNPPTVPGQHGTGANTGAPLDGILGILLLALGGSYGGWMLYDKRKKHKQSANSE